MPMRYHMRRKDNEITDEGDLKKILKTARYVTLAMSRDDEPYLVTLSHAYDEDRNCVYFHCAQEGKKLDYIKANAAVWGQALLDNGFDEKECSQSWATVMFSGKVSFVEDEDEKWDSLALMTRQLVVDPERLIATRSKQRVLETVVGRIDIDYMSGKKTSDVTL